MWNKFSQGWDNFQKLIYTQTRSRTWYRYVHDSIEWSTQTSTNSLYDYNTISRTSTVGSGYSTMIDVIDEPHLHTYGKLIIEFFKSHRMTVEPRPEFRNFRPFRMFFRIRNEFLTYLVHPVQSHGSVMTISVSHGTTETEVDRHFLNLTLIVRMGE